MKRRLGAATPKGPPPKVVCQRIEDSLSTLRALLRLIDPQSPFQPILLSSIDIFAWLSLFDTAAKRLGESLRELPNPACRTAVLTAGERFFRLTFPLCEAARIHAFPPAVSPPNDAREIAAFTPDAAMCEEDAGEIADAMGKASRVFDEHVKHRELLISMLDLTAQNLKKSLNGPNGLLRLIKRRCRTSRTVRRQYGDRIDGLSLSLAALPDPKITPWGKCRIRFSELRHQLETDLLPELATVIKEACAGTLRTPATESLKKTTLQAVTAFLEADRLARSFDNDLLAVQYHTLFRDLLAPVPAALAHCGICKAPPSGSSRVIEEIRRLSPEVIKKDVLVSWDAALPATDPYTAEVVLAALHHLERKSESSDESPRRDRQTFGVSEEDLAGWVRRGNYAGADPHAETSKTKAAETKRIGRTLQHLRRVGAAFHDRRLWTPTHSHNARSTQQRLWTVNPLLALLPRINSRIGGGSPSAVAGKASMSPGSRPRPTRRNRGTQPRG